MLEALQRTGGERAPTMVATTPAVAGVRLIAARTGLTAGASAERITLSTGSALIAVCAAPAHQHACQGDGVLAGRADAGSRFGAG